MNEQGIFVVINVLILGLNFAVLGMTVKLYTEYFKDKSISARKAELTK